MLKKNKKLKKKKENMKVLLLFTTRVVNVVIYHVFGFTINELVISKWKDGQQ